MTIRTVGREHASKSFLDAAQPDLRIQRFTENRKVISGNSTLSSKATLANEISAYLFGYLEGFRIPTHFVEKVSPCEMLVRKVEMLPIQVLVCNVANNAYSARLGLKEGSELLFPVIEHYYKKPELANPMVNEFHIYSLGLATPDQLRSINRLASKANVVLRSFFERRELLLISIILEFGLLNNQVIIADEISPRTCQFADARAKGKREYLSRNGSTDIKAYTEIRNRVFGTAHEGTPH